MWNGEEHRRRRQRRLVGSKLCNCKLRLGLNSRKNGQRTKQSRSDYLFIIIMYLFSYDECVASVYLLILELRQPEWNSQVEFNSFLFSFSAGRNRIPWESNKTWKIPSPTSRAYIKRSLRSRLFRSDIVPGRERTANWFATSQQITIQFVYVRNTTPAQKGNNFIKLIKFGLN